MSKANYGAHFIKDMYERSRLEAENMRACAPLVLVLLLLQLSALQSTDAFSPLDSAAQSVAINATVASGDLTSSHPSFVPTRASVVKLGYLWIHCGIDNKGQTASIRVYLTLASDAIMWYFELKQVYGGWRGVAKGYADYSNANNNYAALEPSGANGGTGVSVNTENDLVYASGGGFYSVARVWAEGAQAQVYVGECQYGIGFESAQNGGGSASASQFVAMGSIALGLVAVAALVIVIARRVLPARTSQRICRSCGFNNPPYTKSFCIKCGQQLEAHNDRPHRMAA